MFGKKVILTAIFLLSCFSFLSAQEAIKPGVYYLSGAVSFSSSNNEVEDYYDSATKSTTINISPSFNYFVTEGLSLGAGVQYFYSENKMTAGPYSDKFIFRGMGIGPEIRYYFQGNPDRNIIPVAGVSADYTKSGTDGSYIEGHSFNFFVGFDYLFASTAALEPFVSYSLQYISDNNQNTKTFSLGIRTNYFIIR